MSATNKRLPFHVLTVHGADDTEKANSRGSLLAAFAHESDAQNYARYRAENSYSTPTISFRVTTMLKTTKALNGRLVGTTCYEFDGRRFDEAPKL